MTLHAQHLAYLPAARRHQRRMRALKDYQKLVDDLQAAEADWAQTPAARRNRELLAMWQEQVDCHSERIAFNFNHFKKDLCSTSI